ncbi:MAG: MBL fold metallo-hydrolase [Proteobacteria bacterium]|nr:MBL fold metallo-hydrolase [Pseudomonadota bacterium]
MNIKQFKYSSDNFAYLVYGKEYAVAIDPGAVDEILAFTRKNNLTIRYVTNTHTHYDHTLGNDSLVHKTNAEFIDCRSLKHNSRIIVDQEDLLVYKTPGHMEDCLTFHTGNILITGDTLFNGTVGTCFSGDMASFLASIRFLMSFPPATLIYAGHDYVKEAMAFARSIENDNPEIARYMEKYDPAHVVTSLADEFKANPFLRFNDPSMISIMEARGLPTKTELDRWNSLMDLY